MSKINIPILRKNLSAQLLSVFILLIFVVVLALALRANSHGRAAANKAMHVKAELLADYLALGSRMGVFAENKDLLKDVAEGIASEPDVVFVGIFNNDMKPLYLMRKTTLKNEVGPGEAANAGLNGSEWTDALEREKKDLMLIQKPVVLMQYKNQELALYTERQGDKTTSRTIGLVRIALSQEPLYRELRGIALRNVMVALFFITVSVVVIYLWVRKVMKPLEALTLSVKALGSGYDVAQVPVETENEVGNLASAFNTMVHARRLADELLKESEMKYRKLVEDISDVLYTLDAQGGFTYISPAVERISRYTATEFIGRSLASFVYPGDLPGFQALFEKLFSGRTETREFRVLDKDGRVLSIRISIRPVYDDQGMVTNFTGVFSDITERKELENKIRTYEQELLSATSELLSLESRIEERERYLIAADLHDYVGQNLVTLLFKLAAMRKEISSPDQLQSLEELHELISQTIQYTRSLTTELSPPVLEEIGLEAAIAGLAEGITKTFGMAVTVHDDGRVKQSHGDTRYLLFRMVREMLMNAVKHAQAGVVKICLAGSSGFLYISVEDNGIGFDTATVARNHRGFGLCTIRDRINRMGGYCGVESRPGGGTMIILSVPLKQTAEDEEGQLW